MTIDLRAFFSALILAKVAADSDLEQDEFIRLFSCTNCQIVENSTLYISCSSGAIENTSTIWYRNGNRILETNAFSTVPTRINVERNNVLKISNVSREESGSYSCEIISSNGEPLLKQDHIMVDVLYPPVISADPSTGNLSVQLMHPFVLSCDVKGNPQPEIKWLFKNKKMPHYNGQTKLNVSRAVKEHEGGYRCVANNKIDPPAFVNFYIEILFYPEVTTEKNWIHSAPGEKVDLTCYVSANPNAKVDWFFKNTTIVHINSNKYATRTDLEKKTYILTVKNLKYYDFGNYSCRAANFLGSDYKTIHLSGLPNLAIFKSEPQTRTANSYTLIWEVDSYSPIINYNLEFRKQPRGDVDGHWISFIIGATTSSSSLHSELYTFKGLEDCSQYEARVSSKNTFGSSPMSEIFKFETLCTDKEITSTTTEMSKLSTISPFETSEIYTTSFESEENSWQMDHATSICKVPLIVPTLVSFALVIIIYI